MALTGSASDHVSPVSDAQTPQGKLTNVGPRVAGTGLPSGSGGITGLITTAYDLLAWPSLRDELVFDQFATVRPSRLSHNGAVVQFNFIQDLPDDPALARLDENYDVLPTPLAHHKNTMTMWEYGQVVTTTALAEATVMLPIDPEIAERVGRAAGSTIDRLALSALEGIGGVFNNGTLETAAPADVTVAGSPSGTLRAAAQKFRETNVAPFMGGFYAAVITPAEETALRAEADVAGWRYYAVESENNGLIVNRMIGTYEGFYIVVSNRVTQALFIGRDGLAKVHSTKGGYGANPITVVSPQVDRLRRFMSIGWKHLVGYERFRAEAVLTADLTEPAPVGP